MRPCKVVVAYEAPVPVEQVRLCFVRLVERFNFANGCGPAFASGDVLYAYFCTVTRKL